LWHPRVITRLTAILKLGHDHIREPLNKRKKQRNYGMMGGRKDLTTEDAELLAIEALGFLAGDDERLGRFLAVTGIGPETLRAAAAQKSFLAQVLGYLMQDESLLLAFSADQSILPDRVAASHRRLSGHT
jgi:Protein of unknown function (DUF3572)